MKPRAVALDTRQDFFHCRRCALEIHVLKRRSEDRVLGHLHFSQSLHTLQRGLAAIADVLVIIMLHFYTKHYFYTLGSRCELVMT